MVKISPISLVSTMVTVLIVVAFVVIPKQVNAQKRMQRGVNTFQDVEMNPVLTGDGQTMLFMRKYEMGSVWNLMITNKYRGNWGQPQTIDFYNKYVKLYNKHGFFLTYDGKELYFTSRKSPGVGRFDIVFSEYKNGKWTEPENFGKPLNSTGEEGCPSVSPDGQTMYFVQGSVDPTTEAIVGDIYVSKRRNRNTWATPVKITDAGINTGNETKPLILSDNETLVFASRRSGGKGGFDLYFSRLEGGKWSASKPLDVLNDAEDNLHVSIPAAGDIAYFYKMHEDQSLDLFMEKIPEDQQQKKVTMIQGRIEDKSGKEMPGYVFVNDAKTDETLQRVTVEDDGIFWLFLTEGRAYDVAIYDKSRSMIFQSLLYDGRDQTEFQKFREVITLKPISSGIEMPLNLVGFDYNSTSLKEFSKNELSRLATLLKRNAGNKIELNVKLLDYREDTLESRELSEIKVDTLSNEPDSLGNYITKTTYHNNRTQKQAEVIRDILVAEGVEEDRIILKPEAISDPKEERLNTVKVKIRFIN